MIEIVDWPYCSFDSYPHTGGNPAPETLFPEASIAISKPGGPTFIAHANDG